LLSGICAAVDLRITVEQIPDAEYTIGDGPAAADCLVRGSRYLYAFDRSRALEMLIPEWKPARHLLPDDSMHRFTVGEHTLQLVAELDRLKEDDSLFGAWDEVDRRSLYLAAIFHDLGKIDSSKPHSEAGAEMAQLFAQKMSLHSEESSSIVWLIREHLTLAKMARTHDLKMPAAPLELATLCQTRQRLSMLYLLTIADIQAVSSEAMTPHLAESLRQLYDSARSAIEVESVHLDPAQYRSAALEKLRGTVAQESVSQWLAMMPSHYLIGTARDKFPLHFELVERARQGELNVIFENVPKSALTEITICCKDLPQPGLLSRILGVLYAHDLTIHGVRAASTDEAEAIALDQIAVSYRGAILPSNLSAMVSDSIKRCILNEGALDEVLRSHNKNPEQRQRFLHYRFIDGSPAVVETETPLGRGMPYRVTKMLAAFGWNVYVARMGQWADRAVARFYLVDPSGPLSAEKVAAAIEGYR
jgi:[protein-PII] uridylyltransferase